MAKKVKVQLPEEKRRDPDKIELPKIVEKDNKGLIISRVNYPIELKYGGVSMIVPPRGRLPIGDKTLIEDIVEGIVVI